MVRIPDTLETVVAVDPEILGGTPCFVGTRVPLATFFDHVETGYSLDRFLQGYGSVRREQAQAVLDWFTEESRRSIGIDLR